MRTRLTLILASSLALAAGPAAAQRHAPNRRRGNTPAASAAPPAANTAPTASAAPATPASPRDAEARSHFDRGLALFQTQDFNGALAEFQAAYDISHRATVLYNLGVAHQALHHYPEAARAIEQYLREATLTPERRAQVTQGLEEIREFIAHVTIVGAPAGATVSIDGEVAGTAPMENSIAVGTGRHVISAHLPGYRDAQETVLIAGGQTREVRLALSAEAMPNGGVSPGSATLAVHAPVGAQIEIDGRAAASDAVVPVSPGEHAIRVRADTFLPYDGRVSVAADQHRVATVHLASTRMSPAPFVTFAALTVASGVALSIMGAMTSATAAQFHMLTQEDPRAAMLSATGTTQRTVTNVLIGTTSVFAAATVITSVLFFRSGSVGNGTIDLAAAPRLEGGAEASVRVRF